MSSRKKTKETGYNFELRLYGIQYLILAVFIALGMRFYVLQVARHEAYKQRADNNRIREIPIPAPRGAILDRNGSVLVDNTPAYNIVFAPEYMTDRADTIRVLVDILGVDREQLIRELDNPKRVKAVPILVKQNAGDADRQWVAAHTLEHPEITIEDQPQRIYPYGKLACHVLGYIGEISPRQLEKPKYIEARYKSGDIIGQDGLEAQYDNILRGREGVRRVIVDSRGRTIRELETEPPIKGQDLVTTLDVDLQKVAEDQFDNNNDTGVAIALNPQNGEILAMVSRPAFDPNVFASNVISSGENRAEVRAIINNPKKPLYNNAIKGIYPAGSTWKLLLSTAALEEGVITPKDSRLVCGGGISMGNRFVRCMGSHGSPDIHTAIVRSCDGYYYRLGLKMGVDMINDWITRLGMGQRTGIDLPSESSGIIPSREWKARSFPKSPEWTNFDTVLASIGQGSVAITPIQLLRATSGIMVGGEFFTPHLLKEAKETPIEKVKHYDTPPTEIKLSQSTVDILTYGAWGVINEGGTAGGIIPRDLNVGGKTGTAQVISMEKSRGIREHRDHAWLVTFAPIHTDQKPELAVVVLTEHGGFGARASGPKTRMIHAAYFSKKFGRPVVPELIAKTDPSEANKPAKTQGVESPRDQ